MDNNTEKLGRTKGLGLSELLVLLTVTLVLAAILLPALVSQDPKRAEEMLNSTPQSALQQTDETATQRPTVASRIERNSRREEARQGHEAKDAARAGIEKMLTTDIRSGQR